MKELAIAVTIALGLNLAGWTVPGITALSHAQESPEPQPEPKPEKPSPE